MWLKATFVYDNVYDMTIWEILNDRGFVKKICTKLYQTFLTLFATKFCAKN